jgi:hypothetical protein
VHGFGLATARALFEDGARVVVTSRSSERAEEVAAAYAIGIGCDVPGAGPGPLSTRMSILPTRLSIRRTVALHHRRVAFDDLTGDGVDDGAMVTACTAGGVGWPATVQLYSAGPTRLGGIDLGDVTHGGRESVTDLSISNGVVHVSWITQGPGEPARCGTVKMAGDLRVNGPSVNIENVRKLN